MVRRTREERLKRAIEAAKVLHDERVAWLETHVAEPVRGMCGLNCAFADREAAAMWVIEQMTTQEMKGDRFVLHLPHTDALGRVLSETRHRPELLGLDVNASFGISAAGTQAAFWVDGYTGMRHPLDRFDVARYGVGTAFRDFTRDVMRRPAMQPLARLALASLIVERLTMCYPAEAACFLLTGEAPPFEPIKADVMFSWGDNSPSVPAVFVVADPWMTAEQVASLIAATRDDNPVGEMVRHDKRLRRPDPALDYLIAFADKRRPVSGKSKQNMSWQEVSAEWKRLAPQKIQAAVRDDIQRAYYEALETRREKGLIPAKGGETS